MIVKHDALHEACWTKFSCLGDQYRVRLCLYSRAEIEWLAVDVPRQIEEWRKSWSTPLGQPLLFSKARRACGARAGVRLRGGRNRLAKELPAVLDEIENMTVGMARLLLSTAMGACGPGVYFDETMERLQWHAINLKNHTDAAAHYDPGDDLKQWVWGAFLSWASSVSVHRIAQACYQAAWRALPSLCRRTMAESFKKGLES